MPISPTRTENYPEWYQQVIVAADLAETSPVRGCMIIKPWGYAIWENIQAELDRRLKATGHVNAYFPLLIPLSQLELEAKHIEGFAKECAVVTHHRLKADLAGKLQPDGLLEEPYIIRPTSETMIGSVYAKWVQSYRDLPLLINQWANVMRWEMRTRLFLRTSEFLWQEGHTAHANAEEALAETLQILDLYACFAETVLALPVITGEKTEGERFPGAVTTYTLEAMMQDGKALQAGTSHFLGQNFAKAYDIKYLDNKGKMQYVWTTSWGVSTRLIGGIIMSHSDDEGLVLPPRISPQHLVILPIFKNENDRQKVLAYCNEIKQLICDKNYHGQPIRALIDEREIRGGEKNWYWVKKGVPIRLEIGPRDIAENKITFYRRDNLAKDKKSILRTELITNLIEILDNIQNNIYLKAIAYRKKHTHEVENIKDLKDFFSKKTGFVSCYSLDSKLLEDHLKPLKVTPRCIPLNQENDVGKCIFSGKETNKKIIFAKAY